MSNVHVHIERHGVPAHHQSVYQISCIYCRSMLPYLCHEREALPVFITVGVTVLYPAGLFPFNIHNAPNLQCCYQWSPLVSCKYLNISVPWLIHTVALLPSCLCVMFSVPLFLFVCLELQSSLVYDTLCSLTSQGPASISNEKCYIFCLCPNLTMSYYSVWQCFDFCSSNGFDTVCLWFHAHSKLCVINRLSYESHFFGVILSPFWRFGESPVFLSRTLFLVQKWLGKRIGD